VKKGDLLLEIVPALQQATVAALENVEATEANFVKNESRRPVQEKPLRLKND
jgi:multidrug resistance efflux pump